MPAGALRGGKYSAFEGGTRVPFIISWPGVTPPSVSNAMVSQVDLLASFASLLKRPLTASDAPDSYNMLNAFLGKSAKGRDWLVEQNIDDALSIVKGN
jgi:arylsulfatase A-like enzyme